MSLDRFKTLHVMVAIPSNGMWYAQFGKCMLDMLNAYKTYRVGDYKAQILSYNLTTGSMLPHMRSSSVRDVLENPQYATVTHLLFIDADHTFPRRLLHQLLDDDKDVVGINHVIKRLPSTTTAKNKPTEEYPTGAPVFSDDPNRPNLEKVWRYGTGTVLIKRHVLEKIGYKCFDMFFRDEVDQYQGEDWSMVEAMEKKGIDLWVDHKLSLECGHIGLFHFTHDHIGEVVREEIPSPSPELASAVSQAFTQQSPSGIILPNP